MFNGTVKVLGVAAVVAAAAVGVWYIGSKVYDYCTTKDEPTPEPVKEPEEPVAAPETKIRTVVAEQYKGPLESVTEPQIVFENLDPTLKGSYTDVWCANHTLSLSEEQLTNVTTGSLRDAILMYQLDQETSGTVGSCIYTHPGAVVSFAESVFKRANAKNTPFVELCRNHYWILSGRPNIWIRFMSKDYGGSILTFPGFSEGAFKQQQYNPHNANLMGSINHLKDICGIMDCKSYHMEEFIRMCNQYVEHNQVTRGLSKRISWHISVIRDSYEICPFRIPDNTLTEDVVLVDVNALYRDTLERGHHDLVWTAVKRCLGIELTEQQKQLVLTNLTLGEE